MAQCHEIFIFPCQTIDWTLDYKKNILFLKVTTIIDAIKCKLMEDCIMHICFKGTVALYLYEYSTEIQESRWPCFKRFKIS